MFQVRRARSWGDGPSCSVLFFKVALQSFADTGLNMTAVRERLDVDLTGLAPEDRLGVQEVYRLWEVAEQVSGNPMLGLKVAARLRPELFDVLGYYTKLGATLGDAIDRLTRYGSFIGDLFAMELQVDGDFATLECPTFQGMHDHPRASECHLLAIGLMARYITGQPLQAEEVRMTHARPAHAQGLTTAFQAPIIFSAPRNALVFDVTYLALPLPGHDPRLGAILERQVRAAMERAPNRNGFLMQVEDMIIRGIPDGGVGAQDVASAMAMSERTLRRRLKDAGVGYQALLDSVRYKLAHRYLRSSGMDMGEIAYALGFSDTSGFARAFKRWSGKTPGQFRRTGS